MTNEELRAEREASLARQKERRRLEDEEIQSRLRERVKHKFSRFNVGKSRWREHDEDVYLPPNEWNVPPNRL